MTPVLTTQQADGSTGYYSIGLALKSSGITDIMPTPRARSSAMPIPNSTSGYLVPLTQIPDDHRRAERRVLRFGPVQRRPREQPARRCSTARSTLPWTTARASANSWTATPRAPSASSSTRAPSIPHDFVEVWRSPLIPNGPLVIRNALGADWIKKITDFYMALPKNDPACFAAVEGGDFEGFAPGEGRILPADHRHPQSHHRRLMPTLRGAPADPAGAPRLIYRDHCP